jgi:hypothetical protein
MRRQFPLKSCKANAITWLLAPAKRFIVHSHVPAVDSPAMVGRDLAHPDFRVDGKPGEIGHFDSKGVRQTRHARPACHNWGATDIMHCGGHR